MIGVDVGQFNVNQQQNLKNKDMGNCEMNESWSDEVIDGESTLAGWNCNNVKGHSPSFYQPG